MFTTVNTYLDLWRYFYSGMYHSNTLFVGSIGFSLRRTGKYIVFPVKSSRKAYAEKWFYIGLHEKNVIKGNYTMLIVSDMWYSTPIVTNKTRGHIKGVRAL